MNHIQPEVVAGRYGGSLLRLFSALWLTPSSSWSAQIQAPCHALVLGRSCSMPLFSPYFGAPSLSVSTKQRGRCAAFFSLALAVLDKPLHVFTMISCRAHSSS